MTPTGEVEVAIIENGEENVIVFNADALSLKTDGIAANAGGSCPDVGQFNNIYCRSPLCCYAIFL